MIERIPPGRILRDYISAERFASIWLRQMALGELSFRDEPVHRTESDRNSYARVLQEFTCWKSDQKRPAN